MTALTVHPVADTEATLLHSLARACPPLDVHTPYTYWVLAHVFGSSCFIAREGDKVVGFVTAVPQANRIFLWQVGVLEDERGRGVSHALIHAVVTWARSANIGSLEMSIAPENDRSLDAFRSYARKHGLSFERRGVVDLADESDPHFREYEDIYAIELGGSTA